VDAIARVRRNPVDAVLRPGEVKEIVVNPINAAVQSTHGFDISDRYGLTTANAGDVVSTLLGETFKNFQINALVTAINPEILLLDEAIGTGDAVFIQKVRARFQKLMNTASIVLIASHSLDVLRSTCNRLLWLDRGRVKIDDTTDNVLKAYMEALLNPDA